MKILCDFCYEECNTKEGILLSPPDKEDNITIWNACESCWDFLFELAEGIGENDRL